MTPLQKIAMGLVIVLVPAYFPRHPHPVWAVYDAVPAPLGWLLVIAGVWSLARLGTMELTTVKWLAVLALAISVPMWFPQINHLLVPEYNPGLAVSGQWFLSLPQTVFSLLLCRHLGRAGELAQPRDGYVASRFGILGWAFAVLIALPVIAFGGDVTGLQEPTLLLIGLGNIALIYYLFVTNRRTVFGGPGRRDWSARMRELREERDSKD